MIMTPQEFVAKLNEQLEPGDKKILLSDDQAEVVGAPATPTLVVAGAGSGKTEVMSLRALYLMYREGYSPDSILGLTFTRKATSNFADRIQRQLQLMRKAGLVEPDPLAEWGATVSTYNSFASSIVQEHGPLIGVPPRAMMITEARSWQIADALLLNYTGELPNRGLYSMRQAVLKLSADMGDHGVDPREAVKEWNRVAEVLENPLPGISSTGTRRSKFRAGVKSLAKRMRDKALLVPLVLQYRDYKRQNNLMDFTDQLVFARQILQANPGVVADIRGQYQAILLDEFQDTSVGQLELFAGIFRDTAVTAVGDPNQAIYGWRGASAASLAMFLPHFSKTSTGSVLQLRDAWRNWPAILEAANVVAKPDKVEMEARKLIYGAKPPASATSVEIGELRANKAHKGRGVVKYMYPAILEDELQLVARKIINWKTNLQPGEKTPSIAILSRKRKYFPALDHALQDHGIKAQIVGYGGLFTHPTITDIRSVMRILVDPDDGPSIMRLIANLDLSTNDISILWDWARELGKQRVKGGDDRAQDTEFMLDAVMNPPEAGWRKRQKSGFSRPARSRILQLARRLALVRDQFDQGLPQVISRVVNAFDLDIDIQSDPLENQGEAAIDEFIEIAVQFESQTPYATVKNFLDWIDMALEADERFEAPVSYVDEETVQIMTIHQAKGLEWDKVIVVGCTEDDFPGVGQGKPDGESWNDLQSGLPGIKSTGGWTSELGELPYDMRSDRELNGEMVLPVLGSLSGFDVVETEDIINEYKMKLALHEHREARRLAYVAWTRASNELVLSGHWFNENYKPVEPSRYLKQMIIGIPGEGPLAEPVSVEEVTVEGQPEPPAPVITHRSKIDIEQIEESNDHDFLSFPRETRYSRNKITESTKQVTAQIDRLHNGAREVAKDDIERSFSVLAEAFEDLKPQLDTREAAQQQLLLQYVKDAIIRQKQPRKFEIIVELDRLSATQVQRLLSSPEEYARAVRRPLPPEPSDATQLGTIFHRWAEQWCATAAAFNPSDEPETQVPSDVLGESADPADIAGLDGHERARLETMQQRAREIFGDHPENVESVEEPFAYSADGITIRGRYDAIFRDGDHWLIVDWKTGAPPSKTHQSKYLRSYATQLEVYRRALAQARQVPLDHVQAELVFLGGKDNAGNRRVRAQDLQQYLEDFDFERDWKSVVQNIQDAN